MSILPLTSRNRITIGLLAAAAAFSLLRPYSHAAASKIPELVIFTSSSCSACFRVRHEIIPQIEKIYGGKLALDYRDIAEMDNYKLMLGLAQKHGVKLKGDFPVFYLQGKFLEGEAQIKKSFMVFIDRGLASGRPLPPASINLISRFENFGILAIMTAGLVDGINPCALTVLVFFMSFIAMQGYKKRELAAAGLAFVISVFVTYILIGLGLLGFVYKLRGFWLVTRSFNISVGLLSVALGGLALHDFFKYRKTGETQGLILQLPEVIKKRIHAVIGLRHRKGHGRGLLVAASSALITGFIVSVLEAVCTGQLYLPAIAFVIRTSALKWQAIGYLLLYNLMFITPLLIIFSFALLGTTSEQFGRFLRSRLAGIQMAMAILFFCLGAFLVAGEFF